MKDVFLTYLTVEKRSSPHTITAYSNDLRQFELFVNSGFGEINIAKVDLDQIRSFVVFLVDSGISERSINRKVASLRAYFRYLFRQGHIKKNPCIGLKSLKAKNRLPSFVLEKDMVQLLDQFEFPEQHEGKRDQLILELLYGTGIRLSELISLKGKYINKKDQTLKVLGKRNKERIIPISINLINLIQAYIETKKLKFGAMSHDSLLVTDRGKPCYPMLIQRTVKKYLSIFGTIEKRSPHAMRHTYATHLLNRGADLNAVKELLGHSSLAATQVYTHNSMDKLKSVFKKAHPKA